MEFLKDKKYNILLGGPKIQILLVKLPFKNTAKKKKKSYIIISIRQTTKTRKHNILRAKKELEVKIQRSYAVPVEKD